MISGAARKTQFELTRGVPENERPWIFFGTKRTDTEWRGFDGWRTITCWAVSDEDSITMTLMPKSQSYVLIDRETGEYETHGGQHDGIEG